MKNIVLYIALFLSFVISAQQKDYYLPKGNDQFKNKEFVKAEANYRISQSLNLEGATSSFNLGNSIYKIDQFDEAEYTYQTAIKKAQTKIEKHKIYHNLGNTFMAQKKYKEAVEAYKNALRNDPYDEESRYNYALAKELLKNNPDNDNKNDDKNEKNNEDKNKDNEDKDDNKKDSDKDDEGKNDNKKGSDKDNNEDGNNKDQSQKPKPQGGISKQRLESLLDAVNNEEKKTQEKVNMQKEKGKPIPTDKDW